MARADSPRTPREVTDVLRELGLVVLGYFLGAFPTGALVARAHGVDLTQYGSRRTGATNALRVLGKRAAALVFAGDGAKGAVAVALARQYGRSAWTPPMAGLAAVLGHTYSVFLGGRGGRGVATGLGGLLALSPSAQACAAATAVGTIAATRYVSLGSILGTGAGGLALGREAMGGRVPRPYLLYGLGTASFIVYSHRDNIARLLAGTERRLGESEPTGG